MTIQSTPKITGSQVPPCQNNYDIIRRKHELKTLQPSSLKTKKSAAYTQQINKNQKISSKLQCCYQFQPPPPPKYNNTDYHKIAYAYQQNRHLTEYCIRSSISVAIQNIHPAGHNPIIFIDIEQGSSISYRTTAASK